LCRVRQNCGHITSYVKILSRVWINYRRGFGLDDWIYCTLYAVDLHTSQFTVAHALGFSVFTSRLLATDLSQSHCNFKSYMKPSLHRLIPFLARILRLPITRTRLHSILLLPRSYPDRMESRSSTLHCLLLILLSITPSRLLCPFITPRHRPHRKHSLYC
jgi:hypothetical protein